MSNTLHYLLHTPVDDAFNKANLDLAVGHWRDNPHNTLTSLNTLSLANAPGVKPKCIIIIRTSPLCSPPPSFEFHMGHVKGSCSAAQRNKYIYEKPGEIAKAIV